MNTDPTSTLYAKVDRLWFGHRVGKRFRAWSTKHGATCTYLVESYDPARGYAMLNVDDPGDRRVISENALGRTFHRVSS